MISQLRNTIAHFTAEERQRTASEGGLPLTGEEGEEEELPLRPHEQKLINYLVNDYLVRKVAVSEMSAVRYRYRCCGIFLMPAGSLN
jgi:hypothetical protein